MADALRIDEILAVLSRHRVDFVVVGGIAAILQGSPLTTDDLDVLFAYRPENLERLLRALADLEARYVDPAGRVLEPDRERLASFRLHLLRTRCGRLDLLRTVGDGATYEDLLSRTSEMRLDDLSVRVLDLEAVIETKEQADRPKDRFQLPYLRQLLEEIERTQED